MEEQLISFETAKLAKEKGFDISVKKYHYNMKGCLKINNKTALYKDIGYKNSDIDAYSAPTQSLLQKWLREKHKIHVKVDRDEDYWVSSICDFSHGNRHVNIGLSRLYTYEQSLEEGSYNALNIIKI